MTRTRSVLVALGLALAPAAAPAQSASGADSAFRAFLVTFEAATTSILTGDAGPWKSHLSAEPGGTLFTPFGSVVRGAAALAQRYDSAAARQGPGRARLDMEYLSIEVSGDLAAVAALQRSTRMVGSDSTQAGFTRVTMIFRREAGAWKLRHRHMDHLREGSPAK